MSYYPYSSELTFTHIRSPGPGGQNVNKVATGILLRFNVQNSRLPTTIRERLLQLAGDKSTQAGEIVIKATRYRTQERNKQDAIQRLHALIKRAAVKPKPRKKTKLSKAVKARRLNEKNRHSKVKNLRRKFSAE